MALGHTFRSSATAPEAPAQIHLHTQTILAGIRGAEPGLMETFYVGKAQLIQFPEQ